VTRNIDVEALRGLRDRHGAAFPRGRVICREGDTTSQFYVVLQGAVEVWQRDRATGQKRVLFTIPAGGFFGEMSCFSGLPRSATCVAAEDSVLLFFNQETAVQLLGASPRFALGVIQTLCDRLRGANERIAALGPSTVSGAVTQSQPTARPAADAPAVAVSTARPRA
jgi:CRP-like cAMP-binding protein